MFLPADPTFKKKTNKEAKVKLASSLQHRIHITFEVVIIEMARS